MSNFKKNNSYGEGFIEVGDNGFWKKRYLPTVSLHRAAQLFDKRDGKTIIEVGSGIQGEMSGNSVLVWAQHTKAEKIIALDLDAKHIDDVKQATKNYKNVQAFQQDGLVFLEKFSAEIDLLYLDFWVSDAEGDLPGTGRAHAYLEAYLKAKDKLSNQSIILIDDTDHVHPWKHSLTVPEARRDGFKVLWQGRQTLLAK